ncbi:MAG TPA: hypothetical protein V6C88_18195 [Chroococcidiopsis sp.]
MKRYCIEWIQDWCSEHGWTDLFVEQRRYWAFPPHAVMPLPIPSQVLQGIKEERGLTAEEKLWRAAAFAAAGVGIGLSYLLECPMPLVASFIFCAVTVALCDEE